MPVKHDVVGAKPTPGAITLRDFGFEVYSRQIIKEISREKERRFL